MGAHPKVYHLKELHLNVLHIKRCHPKMLHLKVLNIKVLHFKLLHFKVFHLRCSILYLFFRTDIQVLTIFCDRFRLQIIMIALSQHVYQCSKLSCCLLEWHFLLSTFLLLVMALTLYVTPFRRVFPLFFIGSYKLKPASSSALASISC